MKPEPIKQRNVIQVTLRDKSESHEAAAARELTRPALQAATTIQHMQGDNHEVNALAKELQRQVDAVNGGDLNRAEAMLIAQAHTLDELFNNLAKRAHRNMGKYLNAAETYLRLALKAQSQCRATLETLAQIKNPPIVYAKQANIANGPQQVNNGIASHARETENLQNKQSGGDNGLLPDAGTPALAGRTNQAVEAVGAFDRAEVQRG